MNERAERHVETLARDLDTFLSDFFPRKKWQSRVKYDHRAHRFFLDVIVRDSALAGDDRFLSLVAFYSRGQRTMLHERAGLDMQCRLFSTEGADLTSRLRDAEATYRDDPRGASLGRRLAWLGFRQRFMRQVVPRSLLWAVTIVLLVAGFGFTVPAAVTLCIVALLVQFVIGAILDKRPG
jgi:hypothetical protein